MYQMYGLSFREYLELFHQISVPVFHWKKLFRKIDIPELKHPTLFQSYLKKVIILCNGNRYDFRHTNLKSNLETDIPVCWNECGNRQKIKATADDCCKKYPF